MAVPPSPIPPVELAQLLTANRQQVTATIASAIMISSSHQYSIQQALEIMHDIYYAVYPAPNSGAYIEWQKTKDARLSKVHGG
jgi:hypothetical protein